MRVPSITQGIHGQFHDSSRDCACQTMSYERILETRGEVNIAFSKFLSDAKRQLGLHDAFAGPLKDLEADEKKADREYGGNKELVTDYVRGKGIVRTPEEIIKIKEALLDKYSELMEKHGVLLVQMTDFFEDPKDFTGYSALNIKLAVPVGKEGEYQVVEWQVVADQIEAVYDITHPYKAAAEAIHDRAAEEGRELTKEERREAAYNFAACRLYNGQARRDAGYDILLKPELVGKHALTRNREIKLKGMVDNLEVMHRDR